MDKHQTQPLLGLNPEAPARTRVSAADLRKIAKLLPTDRMRQAKGWVEKLTSPPSEDKALLAIHGWLSPTGKLYACGFKRHDALCEALGFGHESEIESKGFCKLSDMSWYVAPRYREIGLTESQWATIERWYERNGLPDSHYMRLFEEV